MLYSAFAILGLPILSGCVATAAAAPPPDVLDNLRYCTIHRQTEVEAPAISRLTATLNQNGAAPLECTFRIPYPDITDVILGALDSQHALDWCTKYLANLTNTTARGNFEIRGPSINKTTHIFFANGTRTNIAAVQNGTVSIPNISGEVGVIGLSSSIFEDATITSLMSVVHIEKIEDNPNIKDNPTIEGNSTIEDNPTINTPWNAIQVAAWAIFVGTTLIYMIILGALHCCGWPEERSRTRVKVIMATIFVVSTITIFILFLLGIWPATLTKYREDAWHFFGSFAIYIINGIWAFPVILRYCVGGRKLINRWRQRRGRNVLHQVQIELQHQDAPTPAPAAIPAAVLVPPHHLVTTRGQWLMQGGEAGGPQGRGLGSTGGLALQDQERLKDWTYAETAILQTGMTLMVSLRFGIYYPPNLLPDNNSPVQMNLENLVVQPAAEFDEMQPTFK
ncbi:hypothetical protein BDD12DRAFT_810344 [Trichophaea hybrida]|nr:hypothetical protein BDD12DRAFT_810344 [Trichophaea hybrida]